MATHPQQAGQGGAPPVNPLVKRGLVAILLLGLALFLFWPQTSGLSFGGPPVDDGTRLVYRVVEQTDTATRRYTTRLRFRRADADTFRLVLRAPHATNRLDVTIDALDPTANPDNDPLAFPAVEKGIEVTPGLLWLPSSHRKAGMNSVAGLVVGIDGLEQWSVWKVLHAQGEVYFEAETGLLAGFDLEIGRTRVSAKLVAIRE